MECAERRAVEFQLVSFQKEIKKNEQAAVRGTTKAAVLEGDPACKDLVAFSVYDTKPVHFLSTACTDLCWREIAKKVYNKDSGISVAMKFLRTNMQDSYNHIMNHVDRADQLRGNYRMDRWTRNRKWWWAIWMWGLETILVNAFVLYRETHRLVWKTQKKRMLTHFQFRKAVALSWLTGKKVSSELNEFTNARKRTTSVSTITNSLSTGSINKKARAVNESSLDPKVGALKGRLNDNYVHFPEPSTAKQPCCSLCRFVAPNKNVRTYTSVFQCDICKVHLCVTCFKPFHTVTSVKNLKSQVISCLRDK
jgi:hypothetical protein